MHLQVISSSEIFAANQALYPGEKKVNKKPIFRRKYKNRLPELSVFRRVEDILHYIGYKRLVEVVDIPLDTKYEEQVHAHVDSTEADAVLILNLAPEKFKDTDYSNLIIETIEGDQVPVHTNNITKIPNFNRVLDSIDTQYYNLLQQRYQEISRN